MMWNAKYGMMSGNGRRGMMGPGGRGMMGPNGQGMMGRSSASASAQNPRSNTADRMAVSPEQARKIADAYLSRVSPGTRAEEPTRFYGYYTIDTEKDGRTSGMLSVNGYSGEVWPQLAWSLRSEGEESSSFARVRGRVILRSLAKLCSPKFSAAQYNTRASLAETGVLWILSRLHRFPTIPFGHAAVDS